MALSHWGVLKCEVDILLGRIQMDASDTVESAGITNSIGALIISMLNALVTGKTIPRPV